MATLQRTDLQRLSVEELKDCARHRLPLPKSVVGQKENIITHILDRESDDLRAVIRDAIQKKAFKRQRDEDHVANPARNPPHLDDRHDVNRYLDVPSDVEVKELYRRFFCATSNAAVERVVCGVCARECGRKQDGVEIVDIKNIPNSHRLRPEVAHVAHELYDGLLLVPEGVYVEESSNVTRVNICSTCGDELRLQSSSPPQFSLANGLWIGPIPQEIQCLTFLEQVIVAHIRNKCYVFKLWPKSGNAGVDTSTLQRAMRGNVTSYDLNIPGMLHRSYDFDIAEEDTRNCEYA